MADAVEFSGGQYYDNLIFEAQNARSTGAFELARSLYAEATYFAPDEFAEAQAIQGYATGTGMFSRYREAIADAWEVHRFATAGGEADGSVLHERAASGAELGRLLVKSVVDGELCEKLSAQEARVAAAEGLGYLRGALGDMRQAAVELDGATDQLLIDMLSSFSIAESLYGIANWQSDNTKVTGWKLAPESLRMGIKSEAKAASDKSMV